MGQSARQVGHVLVALAKQVACVRPRYCLRHRLAAELGRLDFTDYGDPMCPRCKPGEDIPHP